MENITEEDIRNIIDSPILTDEEIINLVKKEMDIDLDPKASKDEWVKTIYQTYINAIVEVETRKQKVKAGVVKKREERLNESDKQISRKQYIIDLIGEGIYKKEEITEKVSEEYGYNITGKSPKTRISRTLRELKSKNLLEELADGILRIKGV